MPKHANTATNDTIYSAEVGNNSDLFPDILRLYVPDGARILDCTYGKGTFWRKVVESKYELDFTDAWMGSDARNLYFYRAAEFDAIVFDPPYAHDSATFGGAQYRNRECKATAKGGHEAVLDLYLRAAREHHRILRFGGIYIVKCQDEVCSGQQCPTHVEIINSLPALGYRYLDLFVLVNAHRPSVARWKGAA